MREVLGIGILVCIGIALAVLISLAAGTWWVGLACVGGATLMTGIICFAIELII